MLANIGDEMVDQLGIGKVDLLEQYPYPGSQLNCRSNRPKNELCPEAALESEPLAPSCLCAQFTAKSGNSNEPALSSEVARLGRKTAAATDMVRKS